MLIQTTPISSLSPSELQGLLAAANSLLQTNEAVNTGLVSYAGKKFRVQEILEARRPSSPQFLTEIVPPNGFVL